MEKKEVFNISDTTKEVTIIHKKAFDEEAPFKRVIKGRIDAVTRFLTKKISLRESESEFVYSEISQTPESFRSIVEVSQKESSIRLFIDPNNKYGMEVSGHLIANPELKDFSINQNKLFTRDELLKLIRFNAFRIENPKPLIDSLQRLKFEVSLASKSTKDQRANVDAALTKNVTTDIPNSFILHMPLFEGMNDIKFMVDILYESTDANIKFWLESTELHQLVKTQTDLIINAEVIKIEEMGFMVIYVD